ncbi:gluconate 2-dehydrogenase subunit 3 family protein [Pedobacter sp. ISL-68]|uniref:gluconate 2-dehydrogenase subunit 3 family protein n=1 Tax=unclassified Pedobacter TaxID=2628915 RepID=UPI001BEBBFC3|nr:MULTISPECIES: gluconate 2-dehydrogenase subunit 3 family protein [unclassified Pedobacter]MBT2564780.1 gluconate 2-dehydrogenase subunit 3 family protein [Pedobacter sp. ISL-64]MBT2593647.1 gluconate 2-dehydrogenase subunit 3 family protein [Pedobacter sp. ISL-68]
MNRRDLLKSIALLTGGTLVGADFLLSSFTDPEYKITGLLSPNKIKLLNELGETILPTTTRSKGARDANVGALIDVIVTDCYDQKEQATFIEALKQLDVDALKSIKKTFLNSTKVERNNFLTALDKEAFNYQQQKGKKENEQRKTDKTFKELPNHYFIGIKQVVLWAYFNSEIGATEALRFVSVPTRYNGCIPYHKGDRSWY